MRRIRRPRRRSDRRPLLRAVVAVLGAAIALVAALQLWYLGWTWYYVDHDPATTAFMERRLEQMQADRPSARLRHEWIDYDRMSPWLKRAVVAAEDARFTQHNGFDWEALGKAFEANLEADGIVRGGSTISQQLAKNLFLSPERSYLRKGQEAAITAMIELLMSKRRILELYLNVIEWGDGVFGAQAAARHYAGTGAARLDAWSAALLAARIPRPRYYSDRGVTGYLYRRASDIYGWMDQVRIP